MNSNQAIILAALIFYILLAITTNLSKSQDCIFEGSLKINGSGIQEHYYQGLITYNNSSNIVAFNLTQPKDIFEDE